MSAQAETFGFETEAKQLLKLMIHSLYSNREVFLRELISNASDAIDRLRFQAISKPELVGEDNDFAIRVAFDKEAKTLTVSDNGIGMSRQEVIDNLGTIARSGTAEFLSQLSGDQKKDATLIGQFGVGFYSAFIVAEEVEVLTRAADAETGVRWISRGEDEYSVAEAEAERGTQVTLRLRDDALEFADGFRLRNLVRKYSDHISVPVRMVKEMPTGDDDGGDAPEAPEWESVNEATALWTRSRSEISDEEYREFYKHVSHDFEDPLSWSHNRVEGRLEYTSLLYLPKRAPFRSLEPGIAARIEALCAARVHHGRRRSIPAALPALRQGRSRFQRLAAERLPRGAAAGRTGRQHPFRANQARAHHLGRHGQEGSGGLPSVLG